MNGWKGFCLCQKLEPLTKLHVYINKVTFQRKKRVKEMEKILIWESRGSKSYKSFLYPTKLYPRRERLFLEAKLHKL